MPASQVCGLPRCALGPQARTRTTVGAVVECGAGTKALRSWPSGTNQPSRPLIAFFGGYMQTYAGACAAGSGLPFWLRTTPWAVPAQRRRWPQLPCSLPFAGSRFWRAIPPRAQPMSVSPARGSPPTCCRGTHLPSRGGGMPGRFPAMRGQGRKLQCVLCSGRFAPPLRVRGW